METNYLVLAQTYKWENKYVLYVLTLHSYENRLRSPITIIYTNSDQSEDLTLDICV